MESSDEQISSQSKMKGKEYYRDDLKGKFQLN
jgi:hypothetical protein